MDKITDERKIKETMTQVYDALRDKGHNPINQIVGYILSEDPTYITCKDNARWVRRSPSYRLLSSAGCYAGGIFIVEGKRSGNRKRCYTIWNFGAVFFHLGDYLVTICHKKFCV